MSLKQRLEKDGLIVSAGGKVFAMQEFPPAVIKKLAHLTDINNHGEARILVSKQIGNKKMLAAYQGIEAAAAYFGHLGYGLNEARYAIDKQMFDYVKKHYSNGQEVYMSF